jgi:hypothetical protein
MHELDVLEQSEAIAEAQADAGAAGSGRPRAQIVRADGDRGALPGPQREIDHAAAVLCAGQHTHLSLHHAQPVDLLYALFERLLRQYVTGSQRKGPRDRRRWRIVRTDDLETEQISRRVEGGQTRPAGNPACLDQPGVQAAKQQRDAAYAERHGGELVGQRGQHMRRQQACGVDLYRWPLDHDAVLDDRVGPHVQRRSGCVRRWQCVAFQSRALRGLTLFVEQALGWLPRMHVERAEQRKDAAHDAAGERHVWRRPRSRRSRHYPFVIFRCQQRWPDSCSDPAHAV